MKKIIIGLIVIITITIIIFINYKPQKKEILIEKDNPMKIYIKVNNNVLEATLVDNSSTSALIEKLKENDITINASDYGNFEKVGELGFTLPRNDENISTVPGDIILYEGNHICFYYDTNNWHFTRLGKITNVNGNELKRILGTSDVQITLSLNK